MGSSGQCSLAGADRRRVDPDQPRCGRRRGLL